MEKKELIWLATIAIGKGIDYETLSYSDYMYDMREETDNVWEYVIECESIGQVAFKEKYSEFKLYI